MEANIFYTAVFKDARTLQYSPEKLTSFPNIVGEFEADEELADIVSVYDVSSANCALYHDISDERFLITI